jgi:hypothetical protein
MGGATRVRVTHGLVDVRRPRARAAVAVPATQTATVGASGVRLDTWPFARADDQFSPRRSAVPPYWADGRECSTGCRPAGAVAGWPLRPFHRQHPLRAGLNELRPSGFHLGVDIQADDGARVYPLASGPAHIEGVGTIDERVQVGSLIYWHLRHRVREGQFVRAYRTVLGVVVPSARHLHLSDMARGAYRNPLRPGGRLLSPYVDTAPPVIGRVHLHAGGAAIVDAFDPQSYVVRGAYETPVLAPAALAWRLYSASGRVLGPLEFALRSSQLETGRPSTVFAHGARNPGWGCFDRRPLCLPRWTYRLAGGRSVPVPLASLEPGRYRLAVYAWDYADNRSERDRWFRVGGARVARLAPAPAGAPRPEPDHP